MFDHWNRDFDGDLIIENLYLGSACSNKEELLKRNITHIVNVTDMIQSHYPQTFKYLEVKVQDHPSSNLISAFDHTREFIDEALRSGGCVFVHCAAGISRSTTVVIAYLISCGLHPDAASALTYVKTKRSFVCPNNGFWEQLLTYQNSKYNLNHSLAKSHVGRLKKKPEINHLYKVLLKAAENTEKEINANKIIQEEEKQQHVEKNVT